jgi:hypothetical protein
MWHMTRDMWHVTRDTWHVTRDMWHVTRLGGWTFSQNFSSLAFTVCDLWYYEDILGKGWLNEWVTRLFVGQPRLHRVCQRLILQKMVRHPTCLILSNKLGHTEDGWRDALCTVHSLLLGLLQGRLPRRLCPGRRARLQKVHCSLLVCISIGPSSALSCS